MNICMFSNTYLPHVGGVARSVHFFAEDLRAQGHDVLIIAPTFSENEEASTEQDILRVPAIQNFNGSDFSVRIPIPFFIDQEIDAFEPDIVHSHHPFLLGDAAVRAALRRNLPLVFTHHTLYEEYTHYVSPDSTIMKQLAINLSTEYANLCTMVVAPSESIARLIQERGVESPVEVIPTGVDIDHFGNGNGEFFRKSHNIPQDAFVIGHLGRLAPEKNLEYLCEAVIEALKEEPLKFRFLVVGSGPSEPVILQMFEEAGHRDTLIMVGKKSGDDLVNAYAAMNLFIFSSKSETQGMVLAEAMAASLPVVALDASGVREIVVDHRNGRLLPEDSSPQSFAEKIKELQEDSGKLEEQSKEAHRTAEQFSRKKSAEKLARLYQSLLDGKSIADTERYAAFTPLEELFNDMKIEWDILTEKTSALIKTVQQEPLEKK
jgi:1,2-diacylglycerol 3-alpha-glucosyltransferase